MEQLNDKNYKKALKSVKPSFDKAMLWDNIEKDLNKKEKKKKYGFFWIFGMLGISLLGLAWLNHSDKDMDPLSNTTGQSPIKHQTALVTDIKAEKSKEDVFAKEKLNKASTTKSEYTNNQAPRTSIKSKSNNINQLHKNLKKSTNTSHALNKMIVSNPLNASQVETKVDVRKEVYNHSNKRVNEASFVKKAANIHILSLAQKSIPQLTKGNSIRSINLPGFLSKPENISEKEIGMRQRLGLAITAGIPTSNYQSLTPSGQTWTESLREAKTDLYALGMLANYYYDLSPKWSLSFGLTMRRVSERYNAVLSTTNSKVVEKDSAIFIINTQGLQEFFAGEQIETTITTTRVQQYNHFYDFGFNLGALYRTALTKKLEVYGELNLAYSPWHTSTRYSENQDKTLIRLKDITSTNHITLSTGIGCWYHKNERLSYQIGLAWAHDLDSRLNVSNISLKKEIYSLQLGVLRNF